MKARHDVYFLRFELPDDPINQSYRWSLTVAKIGDVGDLARAYLGFESERLAQLVANRHSELSVVAGSSLDETHYFDFSAAKVCFFTTEAQVLQWMSDPRTYPYDTSLYGYSLATGLAASAV